MTSLRHLRSSTANKRPDPTAMVDGQLAMNYDIASPGLFFKDDNGTLVKVGPVHIGATAPNVSPAAGGTAGNSIGEQWLDTTGGVYVLKIWDGSEWRSESGTFVDVSGDTMTGPLTMADQGAVRFSETTANGSNYIALQATAALDSNKTITLPDITGTVVTTGDTGTVTSTMLLNGTITNADINASAAIAYDKLALSSGIVNADINASAAIALSKLATGALPAGITIASGNITDGTIVDADVNASAAIAGTKISPDFGSQTIATTGVHSAAVGSAAAPSIAFTGDLNTGIYSPGADQVAISTGGTGQVFINAQGSLGVGTANSAGKIHALVDENAIKSLLVLQNRDAGGSAGVQMSFINGLNDFADNRFSYIRSIVTGAGQNGNNLIFATNSNGADPQEAMRITSSGDVGIGIANPGAILHTSQTSAGSSVVGAAIRNNADAASTGVILDLSPTAVAPGVRSAQVEAINNGANQISLIFKTSNADLPAERMRITSDGDVLIANSTGVNITSNSSNGHHLDSAGVAYHVSAGANPLYIGRNTDDGNLVAFYQAGTAEGSISVAGSTVSYNPFLGSHWGRLADGGKPDILPGTILDTVDQLIEWKQAKFTVDGEEKIAAYNGAAEVGDTVAIDYEGTSYSAIVQNEEEEPEELNKHVCVKVNDTASSKAVFGVFLGWDDDIPDNMVSAWNDLYCAAVGNYFVRIADGETLEIGSLIEADGNGCGIVQDDDIIRSKTVAKITSTIPQKVYDDGSFLVTCVLCCG